MKVTEGRASWTATFTHQHGRRQFWFVLYRMGCFYGSCRVGIAEVQAANSKPVTTKFTNRQNSQTPGGPRTSASREWSSFKGNKLLALRPCHPLCSLKHRKHPRLSLLGSALPEWMKPMLMGLGSVTQESQQPELKSGSVLACPSTAAHNLSPKWDHRNISLNLP